MSRYSKTKEKYYLTFYGINDENAPDVVFTITNPGTTNYTSVPTITITSASANIGVGMRATCTLTAGKITSVILLSKGQGYAGSDLTVAVSAFQVVVALVLLLQLHKLTIKDIQKLQKI